MDGWVEWFDHWTHEAERFVLSALTADVHAEAVMEGAQQRPQPQGWAGRALMATQITV